MVQNGAMEAGNLLSFVIYTVMIGGAIASLGNLYTTIVGALGATERVKEILENDTQFKDLSVTQWMREIANYSIDEKKRTFRYLLDL